MEIYTGHSYKYGGTNKETNLCQSQKMKKLLEPQALWRHFQTQLT